jgi:Holliday junction resolvase RusA-like endonuclease
VTCLLNITIPIKAVGKMRPRVVRRFGHSQAFTPDKTVSFEHRISLEARAAYTDPPHDGPIRVAMVIRCSMPKSFGKRKRAQALAGDIRPMVKPDIDNVLKSVSDALEGVVYLRDSQVVSIECERYYDASDYIAIAVSSIP